MKFPILLALLTPLAAAAESALDFGETLREVRLKPEERRTTTDFAFTNTGDEAVTIAKYDAACSCMSVKVKGGKLRYEPGESGVLRAIFDMGNFSGTVDKSVRVWLEGDRPDEPSGDLTVRVHIPVLVEVEPKTLRWDVDAAAETRTIRVKMNHEEPIQVLSVTCGSGDFETALRTVEEGLHYEIDVTPADTGSPALGVIQIETDCPVKRHANQRAFAVVRPERDEPAETGIER